MASKPTSSPLAVPLTDEEKRQLRRRAHEHLMANLDAMARNHYAFGGRGSVLEADLIRALQYERSLRSC